MFKQDSRVVWNDGGRPAKTERGVVVQVRREYPQVLVKYDRGETEWTPARDLRPA